MGRYNLRWPLLRVAGVAEIKVAVGVQEQGCAESEGKGRAGL